VFTVFNHKFPSHTLQLRRGGGLFTIAQASSATFQRLPMPTQSCRTIFSDELWIFRCSTASVSLVLGWPCVPF
jgi:hypothetical protein